MKMGLIIKFLFFLNLLSVSHLESPLIKLLSIISETDIFDLLQKSNILINSSMILQVPNIHVVLTKVEVGLDFIPLLWGFFTNVSPLLGQIKNTCV